MAYQNMSELPEVKPPSKAATPFMAMRARSVLRLAEAEIARRPGSGSRNWHRLARDCRRVLDANARGGRVCGYVAEELDRFYGD